MATSQARVQNRRQPLRRSHSVASGKEKKPDTSPQCPKRPTPNPNLTHRKPDKIHSTGARIPEKQTTFKDIRLNCSHFCIYDVPSKNEVGLITRELGVTKEQCEKATNKPYSFLYVDKPLKKVKRNFYGNI